jgi:cytochrome c
MKLTPFALALAIGLSASGAAQADAAKAAAVMKGSDCLACHAEATKLVGPAYKDVAKKYAGNAGAADALVKKIKAGGSGVWGAVPMTPHPNVKDEDLKVVVEWILSLK